MVVISILNVFGQRRRQRTDAVGRRLRRKDRPNNELILAQMRETQAASQLPADVTNYGVTVQKSVTVPLMPIGVYSPHGRYDAQFLANYA
jgi:hypothetical protein